MLKIDNKQNITLTRGDSLVLKVSMEKRVDPIPPETKPTFEPYEPQQGDSIRFAISKKYKGEDGYELILEKEIPNDTLLLRLTPEETQIPYVDNDYNYDCEITFADGTVDTFISGKFKLKGESK